MNSISFSQHSYFFFVRSLYKSFILWYGILCYFFLSLALPLQQPLAEQYFLHEMTHEWEIKRVRVRGLGTKSAWTCFFFSTQCNHCNEYIRLYLHFLYFHCMISMFFSVDRVQYFVFIWFDLSLNYLRKWFQWNCRIVFLFRFLSIFIYLFRLRCRRCQFNIVTKFILSASQNRYVAAETKTCLPLQHEKLSYEYEAATFFLWASACFFFLSFFSSSTLFSSTHFRIFIYCTYSYILYVKNLYAEKSESFAQKSCVRN